MTSLKASLLNDPNGAIYPDTAMYPVMNTAYRELQTKLSALGVAATKEVSSAITVPAYTTSLVDGGLLPSDLLYPVWLGEKVVGSTLRYDKMDEVAWDPDITQGPSLIYWVWREEQIKFAGATTDRAVLIRYIKGLGTIVDLNSTIAILNSSIWLERKTAALAALTIGNNPTRARELEGTLIEVWDDLKATLIHKKQSRPVRRRRTRYRVP